MFTKSLPIILSFVSLVAAHGFINEVVINGKTVAGNPIAKTGGNTPIRSVSTQDPMKGADNKDLSCGPGSQPAQSMASINPGDDIEFSWVDLNGGPWFHLVGPMLTYMGLCGKDGAEDCSKVDSSSVKWFKIEEAGTKADGTTWYQADLAQGQKAKVTIPDQLASGNYLIRHEIIALHNGAAAGGAEFYAGCVQLKVGGDGTDGPTSDELLEFPGAYKDDDAGILVPGIYDGAGKNYDFPGGPVAKLAAGSSGGSGGGDSTPASSSSPSDPEPTKGGSGDDGDDSTPTPSSSSTNAEPTKAPTNTNTNSGSCKLKRNAAALKKRGSYHPKRHSRVMRNLVSSHHS